MWRGRHFFFVSVLFSPVLIKHSFPVSIVHSLSVLIEQSFPVLIVLFLPVLIEHSYLVLIVLLSFVSIVHSLPVSDIVVEHKAKYPCL